MKRILIAAGWIGLATYCGLASVVGPTGILAYNDAHRALERMRTNLEQLASMNKSFADEWETLSTDYEATILEARSMGFIADDETVVRLAGASRKPNPASPGERLSYEPEPLCTEAFIKELSAVAALVAAVLGLFLRLGEGKRPLKRQREILTQEASRT